MSRAVVLFTRDLRVHDQPALAEAVRTHARVVPLFVFDDAILRGLDAPNRVSFLLEALDDVRLSLRERGGDLVVRRGDPVAETLRLAYTVGAQTIFVGGDASACAQTRERRLERECAVENIDLRILNTVAIVPPDAIAPTGRDHYRVFTPYWRRWQALPLRDVLPAPARLQLPRGLEPGELPTLRSLTSRRPSPELEPGGERAGPRPSCRDGQRRELAPRRARNDEETLARWREGSTGYPIVDAGMRQLAREGWLSNRARLIVASFLTKTLGQDWRHGTAHFARLLVDADVANNVGNWQWMAGTGVDTRPNRVLNPVRQAKRHDPDGAYVRRHVLELADVDAAYVHEPWKAPAAAIPRGYPAPIDDADVAAA